MTTSTRLTSAMFSPSLPCNPIPFAQGLADLVREEGTDVVQTDDAKRILWVLMAQAYPELAGLGVISLSDEWSRLANTDGWKMGAKV